MIFNLNNTRHALVIALDGKDPERICHDKDTADSASLDDVPSTEAEAVLMNLTGDTLETNKFKQVDYSREL